MQKQQIVNKQKEVSQIQKEQKQQEKRTFKSKCGIFFGYNGQKFFGMQYQRDTQNTIQNIIHKILIEGGFILKSNQDSLKRIHWSRAARTDKKVHALCNGISLRLQIGQNFVTKQTSRDVDFDKIRNYLNSELPMDIRVFSVMKANKSFDIRHDALTRVYNYICPINLFQKYQHFRNQKIPTQDQQQQIIEKLNTLCKQYLGTHSYHNLTKGYKPNDPRCDRYMISMKAQKVQPQVFQRYWSIHKQQQSQKRNKQKQKYIRFTLVGQSFIYHQIRKMIGLLIKIFTEELEGIQTINKAFKIQKFDPFLAPGQGLYLNRMTFQSYNRKKRQNNQRTVQLNQQQQQRIIKFRQYLESQILHHQIHQKVFQSWLINRFQYKQEQNKQLQKEQSQLPEINQSEEDENNQIDQQKQEKEQNQQRNNFTKWSKHPKKKNWKKYRSK